jgi:hypothetical protein
MSTSPSAGAAGTCGTTLSSPSPINASSSLSRSSAVLGFLGGFRANRAAPPRTLVRIGPTPPRLLAYSQPLVSREGRVHTGHSQLSRQYRHGLDDQREELSVFCSVTKSGHWLLGGLEGAVAVRRCRTRSSSVVLRSTRVRVMDCRRGASKRCKSLPLARIPSNCFLALAASAGVSNVMMATPDERPLRSYLNYSRKSRSKVGVIFFSGERGAFGCSYPD